MQSSEKITPAEVTSAKERKISVEEMYEIYRSIYSRLVKMAETQLNLSDVSEVTKNNIFTIIKNMFNGRALRQSSFTALSIATQKVIETELLRISPSDFTTSMKNWFNETTWKPQPVYHEDGTVKEYYSPPEGDRVLLEKGDHTSSHAFISKEDGSRNPDWSRKIHPYFLMAEMAVGYIIDDVFQVAENMRLSQEKNDVAQGERATPKQEEYGIIVQIGGYESKIIIPHALIQHVKDGGNPVRIFFYRYFLRELQLHQSDKGTLVELRDEIAIITDLQETKDDEERKRLKNRLRSIRRNITHPKQIENDSVWRKINPKRRKKEQSEIEIDDFEKAAERRAAPDDFSASHLRLSLNNFKDLIDPQDTEFSNPHGFCHPTTLMIEMLEKDPTIHRNTAHWSKDGINGFDQTVRVLDGISSRRQLLLSDFDYNSNNFALEPELVDSMRRFETGESTFRFTYDDMDTVFNSADRETELYKTLKEINIDFTPHLLLQIGIMMTFGIENAHYIHLDKNGVLAPVLLMLPQKLLKGESPSEKDLLQLQQLLQLFTEDKKDVSRGYGIVRTFDVLTKLRRDLYGRLGKTFNPTMTKALLESTMISMPMAFEHQLEKVDTDDGRSVRYYGSDTVRTKEFTSSLSTVYSASIGVTNRDSSQNSDRAEIAVRQGDSLQVDLTPPECNNLLKKNIQLVMQQWLYPLSNMQS